MLFKFFLQKTFQSILFVEKKLNFYFYNFGCFTEFRHITSITLKGYSGVLLTIKKKLISASRVLLKRFFFFYLLVQVDFCKVAKPLRGPCFCVRSLSLLFKPCFLWLHILKTIARSGFWTNQSLHISFTKLVSLGEQEYGVFVGIFPKYLMKNLHCLLSEPFRLNSNQEDRKGCKA